MNGKGEEKDRPDGVNIHEESVPKSVEEHLNDDKKDDKNLYQQNPLEWFRRWFSRGNSHCSC